MATGLHLAGTSADAPVSATRQHGPGPAAILSAMNSQHISTRFLSRRRFVEGAGVAGLGLLAGCGRLPVTSAPAGKVPSIGYLAGAAAHRDELVAGLRELGYTEGK